MKKKNKVKVGVWSIALDDLKEFLYIPDSVDIKDISMSRNIHEVCYIRLIGDHPSLQEINVGAAIPILTEDKVDKIHNDAVEIRELSDKVKFIRYKEE